MIIREVVARRQGLHIREVHGELALGLQRADIVTECNTRLKKTLPYSAVESATINVDQLMVAYRNAERKSA